MPKYDFSSYQNDFSTVALFGGLAEIGQIFAIDCTEPFAFRQPHSMIPPYGYNKLSSNSSNQNLLSLSP